MYLSQLQATDNDVLTSIGFLGFVKNKVRVCTHAHTCTSIHPHKHMLNLTCICQIITLRNTIKILMYTLM